MRIILSIILLLVFSGSTYAQHAVILYGTVRDSDSGNVIPYSSISITRTGRGTAASDKGEFFIKITDDDKGKYLRISSIGFITAAYKIDSLLATAKLQFDFVLKNDIKLLKEIVISESAINPVELIKTALHNVSKNYIQSSYNVDYYSEIKTKNVATGEEFIVESILKGYCEGYKETSKKRFEIAHVRNTGNDPLRALDYIYWPTIEIHRTDQIAYPYKIGILNLDLIDEFNVKYTGITLFDQDTVYKIEYYAPKPSKKNTGYGIVPKAYKGELYITTKTHAIIKHKTETDVFKYEVLYKNFNSSYFPYLIYGERLYNAHKIVNTATMLALNTDNVTPITMKTNEQDTYRVPYDEHFWNENFPRK